MNCDKQKCHQISEYYINIQLPEYQIHLTSCEDHMIEALKDTYEVLKNVRLSISKTPIRTRSEIGLTIRIS